MIIVNLMIEINLIGINKPKPSRGLFYCLMIFERTLKIKASHGGLLFESVTY